MITRITLSILFIVFSLLSFAQTSEKGEYEVYTREVYLSTTSYLSSSFELPLEISGQRLNQKGISYTYNYELANLGNIALSDVSEFRISLRSALRIGATISENIKHNSTQLYPKSTIKYYAGSLDVFSVFLTPQFTNIIGDGTAMTIEFGFNLVNIGGDVALLEGGTFSDHAVTVIKFIPLAFKPAVYFDFGRSGLGIGGYFNPTDILNLVLVPENLYSGKRGVKTFDSFYRRFEFQIIFTF